MAFDEQAFLNMTTGDSMETKRTPVPEEDFSASIKDVKAFEVKDRDDLIRAQVFWTLHAPELEERIGLKEPEVRQTLFIELDEAGGFATGENKNVKLGQLREATGLNSGEFNLGMLIGKGPCLVHVTQSSPENDPEMVYNDVSRVTSIER